MRASASAIDPALPLLGRALDPAEVRVRLQRVFAMRRGAQTDVELRRIRLVRHKIGMRCLIEYRLRLHAGASSSSRLTVLGKMRAGVIDRRTYRITKALWGRGFNNRSGDGISVPKPLGTIPELDMWLQVKVSGNTTTGILLQDGARIGHQLADAIHKLHTAGPPANRRHSVIDELQIVSNRLARVEAARPEWSGRLTHLFDGCVRLADALPPPRWTGIHRDFYQDQVLVAPDGRLYLLDFDLYTNGDPALDVGNFIGHIIELAIRQPSVAENLRAATVAFESRYLHLSGEALRRAVDVYTTLTLARHIYLSTQFAERRHTTERLLNVCEERIARSERSRTGRTIAHPTETYG